MPMTANGLAKLLEELGELAQVASKKLAYFHTDAHPDGAGSLAVRLQEEMGDVAAAIAFVQQQFGLDSIAITERAEKKLAMFQQWHADPANGAEAFSATPPPPDAAHGPMTEAPEVGTPCWFFDLRGIGCRGWMGRGVDWPDLKCGRLFSTEADAHAALAQQAEKGGE